MPVEYNRTSSSEQEVALLSQTIDLDPKSQDSCPHPSSPAKGWCSNPKIAFPYKYKASVKFWPDYDGTQSNSTVTCGVVQGQGNFHGDSGEIFADEYYGSTSYCHNVPWCCTWEPYPFAVKGISFNWTPKHQSVDWGFGNMFLLYLDMDGKRYFKEISGNWHSGAGENWKSKQPYDKRYHFHKKPHDNYGSNLGMEDVNRNGYWAQFQGGHDDAAYNDRACIGWAGWFTMGNLSNYKRDHGFKFQDFYLLPDRSMPRFHSDTGLPYQWIGGQGDTLTNIKKGERRILLREPSE